MGPQAPLCAGLISAAVTGLSGGNLGQALKAGFISMATAGAFKIVGDLTGGFDGVLDAKAGGHGPLSFMSDAHLFNMAGHALVGCASAVAGGAKCGPGALSGAAGSFAGSLLHGLEIQQNMVTHAVVGGLAAVAGGGKFANGAVTAAFGYLFNNCGGDIARCFGAQSSDPAAIQAAWWERWVRDFKVGVTYFGGYGGDLTVGAGVAGSAGAYYNAGSTAQADAEWGGFASTSETLGRNMGRGFFAGFNWGTVQDFQNASALNANSPWVGFSLLFHPEIGLSGATISGPGKAGLSYGPTNTCVLANKGQLRC